MIILCFVLLFMSYATSKKSTTSNDDNTGGNANVNPPTVFILGVQKGGSSSMMVMLTMHPQLCEGTLKETHYFTGNMNKLIKAKAKFKDMKTDYMSYFTDLKCIGKDGSSFVEGTPVMHQAENAAKNMADFYDHLGLKDSIKMIVLLREPVSRDYSWYCHYNRKYLTGYHSDKKGWYGQSVRGSFKTMQTFKEMWSADIEAVKNGEKERSSIPNDIAGDYITQLEQFMVYFRRDQLLILNSEMVFTNTPQAMEAIRQFLGLNEYESWNTTPFPHEEHVEMAEMVDPQCVYLHTPPLDCDFRDDLAVHYSSTNQALTDWIVRTQSQAHPAEPTFIPFGEQYQNITCVDDARAYLDQIIEKDEKDTC